MAEAVSRNADIGAARLSWEAAKERVPQARGLPDPMVRFDYFAESVETRVGPQEYRFGVSQAFPFPGTLRQAATLAIREKFLRDVRTGQTRLHGLGFSQAGRQQHHWAT